MNVNEKALNAAWEKMQAAVNKVIAAEKVNPFNAAKDEIYRLRDTRTEALATTVIGVRNRDLWAIHDFTAELYIASRQAFLMIEWLSDEIVELRSEVAAKKGMVYRGVHAAGEVYDTGDMVTYAGGIWHCNEITEARPGDGNPAWTLAVKKGRDAKGVTRATA